MKKVIYSVVLALVAISLWQCVGERAQPVSSDMAKQLSLLPQTTTGLAYINLEKMRQSPFYEMVRDSMENRMRHNRDFEDLVEATGFDFREDVNEVYVSFDPNPRKRDGKFLLVAIGKYEPERIMEFVAGKDDQGDLREESYSDFTLYRVKEKEYVFCFANENYAVGGHEQYVKPWLDNFKEGKTNAADAQALLERVNQLKYKDSAWMTMNTASLMESVMDQMGQQENMRNLDALRAVQNVNFSMNVNNEIRFDGAGKFSDAEKAQLFHDAIKGALATVKLSLSSDRDAVDVINKIHIKTDDSSVRVDGKMTREDVEKIINHRRALAAR